MDSKKEPQDHLRGKKTPYIAKALIAGDTILAQELTQAENELLALEAQLDASPDRKLLRERYEAKKAEVADLTQKVRETTLVYTFRSIGEKKLDKLIADHPPSSEEIAKVIEAGGKESDINWDSKTFAPALIAKASYEPKLSLEEVQEMFDGGDWNQAELAHLFNTALEAQVTRRVVMVGKG